jgi:hypothetical protein
MAGRHAQHRLAGAQEAPHHIGRQHPLPSLRGHLVEPHGPLEDAGVVDQDVELAELAVDGTEDLLDVGFYRHVALDGDRPPACLDDRLHHAFGGRPARVVVHCDIIAASGREPRGRGPDAAARTGHQHDF